MHMMRQIRPTMTSQQDALADALHEHGDLNDRMESRAAFSEKRKPNFNGWVNPEDRYNMPNLSDFPE